MAKTPFAPEFDDLPEILPVFPLAGVLLLPGGRLPLNIFEPRYLKMVEDALAGPRLIGMIQPLSGPEESGRSPMLYHIGCAGKITEFSETGDGRYLISLSGICRFRIQHEPDTTTPYRQVIPDWKPFEKDLAEEGSLGLNRKKLNDLLEIYFPLQDLSCDWGKIKEASDNRLITCLSMICPFEPKEKQALLEAPCCKARAEIFMTMLEIAVHDAQAQGIAASKGH